MHLFDDIDDVERFLHETEEGWNVFASAVRVGEPFSGHVAAAKPYGIYVDFGQPFPALIETPNLRRDRMPINVDHLPQPGETICGEIIQIVPNRRCVRAIERSG